MALSWSAVDEITHLLFDTDSQHDIAFWLYATASYCVARMGVELLLPGKVKGYTNQQYVVTLVHQVLVLPTCAFGWALGWLDDAKVLIYLLTGGLFLIGVLYDFWTLNSQISERNRADQLA